MRFLIVSSIGYLEGLEVKWSNSIFQVLRKLEVKLSKKLNRIKIYFFRLM